MLDVIECLVPQEVVDKVYDTDFGDLDIEAPTNSYLILRSESNLQSTVLVRHAGGGKIVRVEASTKLNRLSIAPKDACQTAFIDSLTNPDILVNVAIGPAGTGKTTLALAYAGWRYLNEKKPIFMTKPTTTVGKGRAFGPVPGDVQDKYAPYLASYKIVLKKIFGDNTGTYIKQMQERKDIEYVPIELARGCTYEDCTFIIDEVQNLTWHELNTIVSRMGEGTTLIILGDPNQIDIKMNREETGIYKMLTSEAFTRSKLTSAIKLKTQYRSPICALVAEIDDELRKEQKSADINRADTSRSNHRG